MSTRVFVALLLAQTLLPAQSGGGQPVRYQEEYTRIYADDVEAGSPSVSVGFALLSAGSFNQLLRK